MKILSKKTQYIAVFIEAEYTHSINRIQVWSREWYCFFGIGIFYKKKHVEGPYLITKEYMNMLEKKYAFRYKREIHYHAETPFFGALEDY